MKLCSFCGSEFEPAERLVDSEHAMFNLIGQMLGVEVVCPDCWKRAKYGKKESEVKDND